MKRRRLLLALGAAGTVAAVAAGLVAFRASLAPPPPLRIVVTTGHVAPPDRNEREVAEVLESALSATTGLQELRSESTASGVRVTLTLDPVRGEAASLAVLVGVRQALAANAARLPAGVTPPLVTPVRPSRTFYVRSSVPLSRAIEAVPGVVGIEPCGERGPERLVVGVDLAKLQAVRLDLPSLRRALAGGPASDDPAQLGGLVVKPGREPVRLADVATVTREAGEPACRAFGPDGAPVVLDAVAVATGDGAPKLDVVGAEVPPLAADRALVVTLGLAGGDDPSRDDAAAHALQALVRHLGTQPGLVLHGARVLEDGGGELVFDGSNEARRAEVDALRAQLAKEPGVTWRGARGPAWKGVRRLHVVLRPVPEAATGTELAALLARVIAKVRPVPGVIALVEGPTATVPTVTIDLDRPRAAALAVSVPDALWATGLALSGRHDPLAAAGPDLFVRDAGPAALDLATVAGVPVSSVVRVQRTEEPRSVLRVQRERAAELAWEVEDDRSLEARVRQALASVPTAHVSVSE